MVIRIAGGVVVVAYPVLAAWIVVSHVRLRRMLELREVPQADRHIERARGGYEATIREARERLLASEEHLRREAVGEVQARIATLREAERSVDRLRREAFRRLTSGRSLFSRRRHSYLERLCDVQNYEQFGSLQGLLVWLLEQEDVLARELERTLESTSSAPHV